MEKDCCFRKNLCDFSGNGFVAPECFTKVPGGNWGVLLCSLPKAAERWGWRDGCAKQMERQGADFWRGGSFRAPVSSVTLCLPVQGVRSGSVQFTPSLLMPWWGTVSLSQPTAGTDRAGTPEGPAGWWDGLTQRPTAGRNSPRHQ